MFLYLLDIIISKSYVLLDSFFLIDLSIIYTCIHYLPYGSLLPDGSRDVVPGVTQVQPLRQINHRLPINVRYVRTTSAYIHVKVF